MKRLIGAVIAILVFFTSYSQELKHYSCFIDRVDVDQWLKNGNRQLDDEGIIKNNGHYHPLGVVHFGVLNYYAFLERGDSTYYQHFINQVKYFKDTSKYDILFDGKGIGLPYTFNFHDLKAPWYSGMTQGYALSYLLRYRQLTNDKTITPIIEKIAYQMIQPEKEGGTIGKTPEGYTFIEEYPNGNSKEVFNGFVNGLIGLKEYCDFFPGDTLARRIHDESYAAMIKTMGNYDVVDWSNYNRGGAKCSIKYMRYEIFELKHLFEIYGDSAILDQLKLWSYYGHNKPNNDKATVFKLKNFQTAEQLSYDAEQKIFKSKISLDTIFYSNIDQSVKGEIQLLSASKKQSEYTVFLNSETANFNYLDFSWTSSASVKKVMITSDDNSVKFQLKKPTEDHIYAKLEQSSTVKKLNVQLKGKGQPLLTNLFISKLEPFKVPFYQFYKKAPIQVSSGTYSYKIDHALNAEDITVFYRTGKDPGSVKKTKWSTSNMSRGKQGDLVLDLREDGYIELMVIYSPSQPYSEIGDINFKKAN